MSTERAPPGLSRAFGLAVRTLRTARGVSQEAFADECELDRTYISQIERGIPSPTLKTLWILARALGKSPRDLIERTEAALQGIDRSPGGELKSSLPSKKHRPSKKLRRN